MRLWAWGVMLVLILSVVPVVNAGSVGVTYVLNIPIHSTINMQEKKY